MTKRAQILDRWICNDFKEMNTELEELYFQNHTLVEQLLFMREYKESICK